MPLVNYYYRYLGDYAKDTTHLTLTQNGAYNFLLDRYYATEKGIPTDEVYLVCRAYTKPERKAVDKVLAEFFTLKGKTWGMAKCDKEITKYRDRSQKAKDSANARWSHSERNANAMPTQCEGNAIQSLNLQSPIIRKESEDKNVLSESRREAIATFAASGLGRVPR